VYSPINRFLLENGLCIAQNPCVSPDFCLNWAALEDEVRSGAVHEYPKSRFITASDQVSLVEDLKTGDCAWKFVRREGGGTPEAPPPLLHGVSHGVATYYPATWDNLLLLKNLVQEHDPDSTIFPTATAQLGRSTLGVGARFTTLHWPAVEWTMAALGVGFTANQNSIPRELVYDVGAMLEGQLDTVPFPFIGADVPEGHQGQSVEGMSHGCVLSKLKTGFHTRRIAWAFNADHQPIGGKFDVREDALVRGCLLASYITFDLSPELALGQCADLASIPSDLVAQVRARVAAAGVTLNDAQFNALLATVWMPLLKMKRRDEKYTAMRASRFTTEEGRRYLRELSIDELPGVTTPETTAVMLALCEVLEMPVNFIAPAFGFQKNTPYPDNAELECLIAAQWAVCERFGVSIGFHSGSGKSAENYQVMGRVTGCALEIKTSGRYTYEMGVALSQSSDPSDARLWRDWYQFSLDMAVSGAFSENETEREMARSFIVSSLEAAGCGDDKGGGFAALFADEMKTRAALDALEPSAEHMVFFEYNFLYVLAANGRAEKSALGDHSPAGYRQRARFYAVSAEARLHYAKRVAEYLIFLAKNTGLATAERCAAARSQLEETTSLDALVDSIAP